MADTPPIKPHFRSAPATLGTPTADNYQNLTARLGIGADNIHSASTYGYNPITRNRQLLEFMYRGSWIVGRVIDVVAEDMARAGVRLNSSLTPDEIKKVHRGAQRLSLWDSVEGGIKWSRLYGGALLVMLIDGQDAATPLDARTIAQGQFKGVLPMDRWMVQPTFNRVVEEYGPSFGDPAFYYVTANVPLLQGKPIHHSRVIRLGGRDLPWYQRQTENFWGMSEVERLYDRLVAFDSTTAGAAQLVYKAYLRTYKVKGLRQILAGPPAAQVGLFAQIDAIRKYQSAEGITLMDAEDEMEALQYGFTGLSDLLSRFAEQVSGATGIPLVRLMGQSPAGFSTGAEDVRSYYDLINSQQNATLRRGVQSLYEVLCYSELGRAPPEDFSYDFEPLWQMSEKEKADVASTRTQTALSVRDAGDIGQAPFLRELKQMSDSTGAWSNITDDDIAKAEELDANPPKPVLPEPPSPDDDKPASEADKAGVVPFRPTSVPRVPAAVE